MEKEQLVGIYQRYRHIFSDRPGKIRNFKCKLRLKPDVKFNKKSYPIPQAIRQRVRAEIQRMFDEDIIEGSQSPYTSQDNFDEIYKIYQ